MRVSHSHFKLPFSHADFFLSSTSIIPSPSCSPGYLAVVPGEGMPSTKQPSQRGDLRLTLQVVFPRDLSTQQKRDLQRVLAGSS